MATVKIIEIVGTSDEGWEDAAQNALEGTGKTIHNISGVEVVKMTAKVTDGSISEYRATVKVAFKVDD